MTTLIIHETREAQPGLRRTSAVRQRARLLRSHIFNSRDCMNSANQSLRTRGPLLLVFSLVATWHICGICPVAAQSVGVNFVGGAGAAGTLAPSDVAGVPGFAQAFWNNAPVSSGPLPGFGSLANLV